MKYTVPGHPTGNATRYIKGIAAHDGASEKQFSCRAGQLSPSIQAKLNGVFKTPGLCGVEFMAFISNCPKCQNPVLVPDGTGADAVVQCPVLGGRVFLGRDYGIGAAGAIVVHPGIAAATTLPVKTIPAAAAALAEFPAPDASEATFSRPIASNPSLHDAEPLLFEGDEVQLAARVSQGGIKATKANLPPPPIRDRAMFEHGPETTKPTGHSDEDLAEPFWEPLAAATSDEVHDLAAEPDDAAAPWGGEWGGLKDEAEHEEDGAAIMAEGEQDEGLEQLDFADITGKAAARFGACRKPRRCARGRNRPKKKRKREPNMIVRLAGCADRRPLGGGVRSGIAIWMGKNGPLPAWLPFSFGKSGIARGDAASLVDSPTRPPKGRIRYRPLPFRRRLMRAKPGPVAGTSITRNPQPARLPADNPMPGKRPDQMTCPAINPAGQTSAPGNASGRQSAHGQAAG